MTSGQRNGRPLRRSLLCNLLLILIYGVPGKMGISRTVTGFVGVNLAIIIIIASWHAVAEEQTISSDFAGLYVGAYYSKSDLKANATKPGASPYSGFWSGKWRT